ASSTSGATDTSGVTTTFSVNASASTLPPGTHGPGIVFTNLSSGRGNTVRFARPIVRRPPPSRPADQIERRGGGYLLDGGGGYLLDDRGRRYLPKRSAARRQPPTARENLGRAARCLARFFPAQPQTRNFAILPENAQRHACVSVAARPTANDCSIASRRSEVVGSNGRGDDMAFFTQSKAVRYLLGISGPTILALGLWLLLLATNPGRNETIDVGVRLAVTRQLWTAGKVAVDRPHVIEGLWIEMAPDRYVAPYGIGQSLVFVPFDMVSSVLEHFTPEAWRGQLPWLPIGFGLLPLLGLGYWYAL